ncbi:MAG: DUF2029 domain-containing protein [Bacteroidetes bacterium]|nr:DUF2029 domain-containing protein [Bacteroidota bacterium]
MYKTVKDFFLNRKHPVLVLYLLAATIATLQAYYGGEKKFDNTSLLYTHYNNFLIFKQSFFHLKGGIDLYKAYPAEYYDLYKYSPTCAFLFGFFTFIPDGLGLLIWNVLNALAVLLGVRALSLSLKQKNTILLFVLVELLTSLQNAQSNGLIAGLIIGAFALTENKKYVWSCLCIALTAYIKLFGFFAFALGMLYPQRWKMAVFSVGILFVLGLLPLLVTTPSLLTEHYQSWWLALQSDYVPNPLSLVGGLKAWLGITVSKNAILFSGLMCFAIPFMRTKLFSSFRYRLMTLSSILVWMIVFNHKAESPTFIIAMAGIALWVVSSALTTANKMMLAVAALTFTSLSTTDLFPNFIQDYFDTFSVKALAPVLIYGVMLYEFIFVPERISAPMPTQQ